MSAECKNCGLKIFSSAGKWFHRDGFHICEMPTDGKGPTFAEPKEPS